MPEVFSEYRDVTYYELFEAIIQNGFPKGKNLYYDKRDGTYCSLGQASMNLTGSAETIGSRLNFGEEGKMVWNFVINLNDETELTPQEIGLMAKRIFSHLLNKNAFQIEDKGE